MGVGFVSVGFVGRGFSGVGFVGAGFVEWGVGVSVAAFVGAAGFGLCVFCAGGLAAAGVGAEGLCAAGFGAGSAGLDAAEERESGRRGHRALFSSRCAYLIVIGRRREILGIDIIVVGRSFVCARLVSEKHRRTRCLIMPMITRGPASGSKRVC